MSSACPICYLLASSALILSACAVAERTGIEPRYHKLVIPEQGAAWIEPDLADGDCSAEPETEWQLGNGAATGLFLQTEMQSGSGRYWNLRIGVGPSDEAKEPHGVLCIGTTTIGWRTLRQLGDEPLRWLGDIDNDGLDELILWDSFPIDVAQFGVFGLTAWVYSQSANNELTLNWQLTRQEIQRIANAYRQRIIGIDDAEQLRREQIADQLQTRAEMIEDDR